MTKQIYYYWHTQTTDQTKIISLTPTPNIFCRQKKQTAFNNYKYTTSSKHTKTPHLHISNKAWNTYILPQSLHTGKINRLIQVTARSVNISEVPLTKAQRRTIAQIRANKSSFLLLSYLHKSILHTIHHHLRTCVH